MQAYHRATPIQGYRQQPGIQSQAQPAQQKDSSDLEIAYLFFSAQCQYCIKYLNILKEYHKLSNKIRKYDVNTIRPPYYVTQVPCIIAGQNIYAGQSAFNWLKEECQRNFEEIAEPLGGVGKNDVEFSSINFQGQQLSGGVNGSDAHYTQQFNQIPQDVFSQLGNFSRDVASGSSVQGAPIEQCMQPINPEANDTGNQQQTQQQYNQNNIAQQMNSNLQDLRGSIPQPQQRPPSQVNNNNQLPQESVNKQSSRMSDQDTDTLIQQFLAERQRDIKTPIQQNTNPKPF